MRALVVFALLGCGSDDARPVDAAPPPADAAVAGAATPDAAIPDAATADAGSSIAYGAGFEGPCPDGWTLTGDWECGVPTNVGPAMAYTGAQCMATKVATQDGDGRPGAGTSATSRDLDMPNGEAPTRAFRTRLATGGRACQGRSR